MDPIKKHAVFLERNQKMFQPIRRQSGHFRFRTTQQLFFRNPSETVMERLVTSNDVVWENKIKHVSANQMPRDHDEF